MKNIENLPKWAQSYIQSLESKIKGLELHLETFQDKDESNVKRIYMLDKHNLPMNSIIEFTLPKGKITVRIDSNGELDVNSDSRFDFVISPKAANNVTLTFKEYPN